MVTHAEIASESRPQALDEFKSAHHNVIETLPLDLCGWHVRAVAFHGRTDLHNTPVTEESHDIMADSMLELSASLLFLEAPDREQS